MKEILGIKLYTAKETAELLDGITQQTLRRYVREGLLKPTLIGKTKYFSEEQLKEYLSQNTKG